MSYHLAVDIGASSGRHILGHLEGGRLVCREVHRFQNQIVRRGGHLCWDVDALFEQVLEGMRKCAETGCVPHSVGIDSWGVDYVLVDGSGDRLGDAISYRDTRTEGADAAVYAVVDKQQLYRRTGTQMLSFNTIFQLRVDPRLDGASALLLIADHLHHRLCGVAATEYTNATTTGLVNAHTRDWDYETIGMLGYNRRLFQTIVPPGTTLGRLRREVAAAVGFDCNVTLPATHDTASAVVALPSSEQDTLYISSGTWSLMGVERDAPDCSPQNMEFTNEGGYDYRYRYLKNIMGLWMIQSVRRELDDAYTFDRLCTMAEGETIPSIVDCNHPRFLAPDSMSHEVRQACRESHQPVPDTVAQLAAVIYNSLAVCYVDTAARLESLTGKRYSAINIVGGGSGADYLNRLTARRSGKTVLAGPMEATAIGNLLVQMLAAGGIKTLGEARTIVKNSFDIKEFLP